LEEVRADAFETIVHAMDKIKAMVIAAGASAVALRLFGGREAVPGASDAMSVATCLISEHVAFEKGTAFLR
jgi:hypothetical protein